MVKRSSKEQSTHHRKVRELSRELKRDGYTVKADIRGYQSPCPIGKSTVWPDIVATRSGTTKIPKVKKQNVTDKFKRE